MNVAVYGAGHKRWAMTERASRFVERERTSIAVGPSSLAWDGSVLEARIDERTVPFPSRIRGRIRFEPVALAGSPFQLDAAGLHGWHPWAPRARVEVSLDRPALRFRGDAYLDSNWGAEPLEDGFERWHWSRATDADGGTTVFYDGERRDGSPFSLALRFDGAEVEAIEAPPSQRLPSTLVWRIPRESRGVRQHSGSITTLEDSPFYARSVLSFELPGRPPAPGVHETLSLQRFRRPWVQALLPFRMPRRS